MPFRYEMKFRAETKNLIKIEEFIVSRLAKHNIDREIIDEIVISVDEAATNIIIHAYHHSGSGTLRIVLNYIENTQIIVTLYDRGEPFNPESIEEPNLEKDFEHRSIGGLGLFLMRKFMDEVHFSFHAPKAENELQMVKNLV